MLSFLRARPDGPTTYHRSKWAAEELVRASGLTYTILKAGGHFGEMGLVDHAPRSATVVALDTTSAVALGRDALLKLMRKDSLLAVKLL